MKNKKRTKKQSEEEKKKIKSTTPNTNDENETNDPFDFGGIPARDLKKNLGCG
jgi:hypothetical protein